MVTSTPAPATEAPATAAEPTFATTERYVICDVLNVRSEPVFSGSENLIGSLYYGDPIDVVETGEDYFKILWFEDGYDFAYVNSGVAYTSDQEPDKIETAPLSTADPNLSLIHIFFCGNGRACRPCLWQSRHESVFRAPPAFDL